MYYIMLKHERYKVIVCCSINLSIQRFYGFSGRFSVLNGRLKLIFCRNYIENLLVGLDNAV